VKHKPNSKMTRVINSQDREFGKFLGTKPWLDSPTVWISARARMLTGVRKNTKGRVRINAGCNCSSCMCKLKNKGRKVRKGVWLTAVYFTLRAIDSNTNKLTWLEVAP